MMSDSRFKVNSKVLSLILNISVFWYFIGLLYVYAKLRC